MHIIYVKCTYNICILDVKKSLFNMVLQIFIFISSV